VHTAAFRHRIADVVPLGVHGPGPHGPGRHPHTTGSG